MRGLDRRGIQISLIDLFNRYSPELPPVLQGISFTIKPGERVAVAGRTGSGKVRRISLAAYHTKNNHRAHLRCHS